jgi:hypothetical protein
MDFIAKDFDGLLLPDIYNLQQEDAFEKYPVLKKYSEFNKEIEDFNKVLKYISFMYDSHSPLLNIEYIPTRKSEALFLAGFDIENEYTNTIIQCSDESIASMIIKYVRLQKNPVFAKLIIFTESFYKQGQKLLTDDVSNKEKTKDFINNMDELEQKITNATSILLNQDMNKRLSDTLYEVVEEELNLRPELMSKMLREEGKEETNKYLKNEKRKRKS